MAHNITRRGLIVGGAAAVGAGLVACGSDEPGATGSGSPSSSASGGGDSTSAAQLSGTITFAAWDSTGLPQKAAKAFEAANPGVKVQVQITPWGDYWTKLQTSAAAGNAPDVFLLTPAPVPALRQQRPADVVGRPGRRLRRAPGVRLPRGPAEGLRLE